MASPAMALLQQHDARQDILIELVARRRVAIEAWGVRNWGDNRAVKTNRLDNVCVTVNKRVDKISTALSVLSQRPVLNV